MENNEHDFRQWILYADRDLHSAEILFLHAPDYYDMIGFHCQQAVEKYLKAYLVFLKIDFPKTHNLNLLVELIDEKIPFADGFFEKANSLMSFAVEVRYPAGRINFSAIDIASKIEIANDFKTEILKLISE